MSLNQNRWGTLRILQDVTRHRIVVPKEAEHSDEEWSDVSQAQQKKPARKRTKPKKVHEDSSDHSLSSQRSRRRDHSSSDGSEAPPRRRNQKKRETARSSFYSSQKPVKQSKLRVQDDESSARSESDSEPRQKAVKKRK
jgi:hypothetical protein